MVEAKFPRSKVVTFVVPEECKRGPIHSCSTSIRSQQRCSNLKLYILPVHIENVELVAVLSPRPDDDGAPLDVPWPIGEVEVARGVERCRRDPE